ncbi:hypothetical protein TSMEX_002328 [Taenia solium]|eukprot:TsM_000990800 transcript=TsM_000990800 gene=TsM_000990800
MNFEGEARMVIIASGFHHRIATGQYRIRHSECEDMAKHSKMLSPRDLQTNLPQLKQLCLDKFDTLSKVDWLPYLTVAEACEALSATCARRLRHIF